MIVTKRDENGKPMVFRVKNPITGNWMCYGCVEAARWLLATGKIAKISGATVRAIADGRAKYLQYNPDTVRIVKREFPAFADADETEQKKAAAE